MRTAATRSSPTDNTGNKGDLTGQAFVDYCLSDTMTADELETQVEEITARTIADAEE